MDLIKLAEEIIAGKRLKRDDDLSFFFTLVSPVLKTFRSTGFPLIQTTTANFDVDVSHDTITSDNFDP